jgi:hypothetical protein
MLLNPLDAGMVRTPHTLDLILTFEDDMEYGDGIGLSDHVVISYNKM